MAALGQLVVVATASVLTLAGCGNSSSDDPVLKDTAEKSCELAMAEHTSGDPKKWQHNLSGDLNPTFVDNATVNWYTAGDGNKTYKVVCDGRFDDVHVNAISVLRSKELVGGSSPSESGSDGAEGSVSTTAQPTTAKPHPTNAPVTPPSSVIPDTDFQGFISGAGPRCDGSDVARFIGVSINYQAIVCHTEGVANSYIRTRNSASGEENTYQKAEGLSEYIVSQGPTVVDLTTSDGMWITVSGNKVADEKWTATWKE